MTKPFTRKQWFTLPLALRRRWWTETGFNTHEPSPELSAAIRAAIPKQEEKL